MYKNTMYFKKFILFLILLVCVSACVSYKKTTKNKNFDNVTWQYSSYIEDNKSIQKSINKTNPPNIIQIDNSLRLPLISQPIILDSHYIGMNKNEIISKINIINRKTIWKNKFTDTKLNFISEYLNGGLLQIKNKTYATFGSNSIICFDNISGKLIWRQKLQQIIRAYPIFENNILYLQTLNNGMYAIDANNGKVLWYKYGMDNGVRVTNVTSPILYKNIVILQDSMGNINAIDKYTSFDEWNIEEKNIYLNDALNDIKISTYQPLIRQDHLYFYTSMGNFIKLNLSTRELEWKQKLNINRPFYIQESIAYAIDDTNQILSINLKNGSIIWKSRLIDFIKKPQDKKKNRYWNQPIVVGNIVYVYSSKGELLKLDSSNGTLIDIQYKVGKGSYIAPIFSGENLYIVS